MNNVNWEEIRRREWPVLDTMTFLDAACVSFAPQRTVKALKAFADFSARQDEANSSAHHIAMDQLRNKAYQEAAKLLNADIEEIAVVESTSHGLNIAANAIEFNRGDNVVTTNLEFIQVALPWCMLREEKDIEVRVCKTEDSRFTSDDFKKVCDANTKMIILSTVEWCNGWRMDLESIGQFCKENNIIFVCDAVQELGVGKIDVKKAHIDILTAGGHKWLNSPFGAGVMYINKETMPKLKQVYWGYLNTAEPEEGWGGYWENPAAPSTNIWQFPMTARRFEIGGTSNYPGTIALGESLELVNEIGIENIEMKIKEITSYCMDQIEAIGGTLITHKDENRRVGIIIARLYDDYEVERKILKSLHAKKVFIAQRFTDYVGGFRISCTYFNTKEDIDKMIAALKEEIEAIGSAPDYKQK